MSRRPSLPSSKHHILIYDEDWEFLDEAYGRYSGNQLGTSTAIRAILHRKVLELRQRATEKIDRRTSQTAVEIPQILEEESAE